MLSVRLIALHSSYLDLINNKLLSGALCIGYFFFFFFREVGKQCTIGQLLLSKHEQQQQQKAYKHKKTTIAINKHPENTNAKRFFFLSPLLLLLILEVIHYPVSPKDILQQKCAVKESERNCVDGWSSSRTSVLQYTCPASSFRQSL